MNTLENKIQAQLVDAMKNHQENTVAALRSLKTAIMEVKTAPNGKKDLDDNDIVAIIQKLVKQRKESMDIYSAAGRHELADKEQQEMFVLMNYLPKMLSEDELLEAIKGIIAETGATDIKQMGIVMKTLKERRPNQYDGALASRLIKEILSQA